MVVETDTAFFVFMFVFSRNLIPCDKDNLADPYVRVYVMPDHSSETKRKTKLVKNTLNPLFDERLGNLQISSEL